MRTLMLGLALLTGAIPCVQASVMIYEGTLGKAPITLVLKNQNAQIEGVYAYTRYRTPIRLKPTTAYHYDRIAMDELDSAGLPSARLHFSSNQFSMRTPVLEGTWTAYATGKQLKLSLRLTGELGSDDAYPKGATLAVLQAQSSERLYFMLPMEKSWMPMREILVMDKTSGKQVQALDVSATRCIADGLDAVQVQLSGGRLQLVVPPTRGCLGKTFEWNASSRQFDAAN